MSASRTRVETERQAVTAYIEVQREEPHERTQERAERRSQIERALTQSNQPARIETQMLQRIAQCLVRAREQRPPDCPREPPPPEWAGPRLPAGGDFAEPETLDLNEVYTPAELRTLVMPSCVRDGGGVCVRMGRAPPPPSRSAEDICEAGGIGPCHPPPFRPDAPDSP